MKLVAETLDVSRSNVSDRKNRKISKKGAYRKTDDVDLLPRTGRLWMNVPATGIAGFIVSWSGASSGTERLP